MVAFYPNVKAPLPRASRTTSLSGKPYVGGYKGKLDTLEEWEGFQSFQDSRSPTGWIDKAGHVIGGMTTAGVPLLLGKDGKLHYNPASSHHGLFGGGVGGTVFAVYTGGTAQLVQTETEHAAFGAQFTGLANKLAPEVANLAVPGLGQAIGIGSDLQSMADDHQGPAVPQAPPPGQGPPPAPQPTSNFGAIFVVAAVLLLLVVAVKS